jgi:hypothetical protein
MTVKGKGMFVNKVADTLTSLAAGGHPNIISQKEAYVKSKLRIQYSIKPSKLKIPS